MTWGLTSAAAALTRRGSPRPRRCRHRAAPSWRDGSTAGCDRSAWRSCCSSSFAPSFSKHSKSPPAAWNALCRSEEHTSELQSQSNLVCRLLLEKKKKKKNNTQYHQLNMHTVNY